MVTTAELAEQHRQQRRQLAAAAVAAGAALWDEVDDEALSESWLARLARLVDIVTGAQRAAARQADDHIGRALALRGIDSVPVGRVVPSSLAGVASDGRPLESLLLSPVVATKMAIARGADVDRARATGRATLDMTVSTQVADAGRVADGVAMATRPVVVGYERIVHLPACARCIILAGRLYRWSTGFARHPRCDCTMEPVTRDEWQNERPENEPRRLFERMSQQQRNKAFTEAGAAAIADGADPSQVVNARRGMSAAGDTTTEGTTRRGLAGGRLGAWNADATRRRGARYRSARAPRLMPETIYRIARDRDEALAMLQQHGYIL